MGTLLGSLQVNVDANTSKFDAGMARGKKSLGGFNKATASATAGVGKFVGVLGGALTVAAFTGMLKRNFQLVDALGKTADQIGISTEALAGLQHAADQTGVSADVVNDVIKKMQRNLADAAHGTGIAGRVLDDLNLSAADLVSMQPDKALGMIADAMKAMENPTERMRVAMTLFGRAGSVMISTLMEGSEGLRAYRADAEKLGIALSRDQVFAVEAANDAYDRFSKSLGAFGRNLAVEIAPILKVILDDLTNINGAMRDTGNELGVLNDVMSGRNFLEVIADGVSFANRLFQKGQTYITSYLAGAAKLDAFLGTGSQETADSLAASAERQHAEANRSFDAPLPSERAAAAREEATHKAEDAARKAERQREAQLRRQAMMETHLRTMAQQAGSRGQPVPVRF